MVEYKKCTGECGLEKEETEENFLWRNDSNKFRNECKICRKIYKKQYRQENIDEINMYDKKRNMLSERKEYKKKYNIQYYQDNKEEMNEYNKQYYRDNKEGISEYQKQYRQEHKKEGNEYKRKYKKERRKSDPIYKFMSNISRIVNFMLKGKKAGKSSKDILPFTEEQIIEHIETEFKKPGNEWMHWGNQGVYNYKTFDKNPKWQLDHITPISHFDIQEPGDAEFIACWDLSNLRPLSAKQNIIDGARKVRHAR